MDEDLNRAILRAMAEKRLEGKPFQEGTAEDSAKLIAELTIHQEELNIQNEELKRIQLELEAVKAKYFEIYDLAPIGYVILNSDLMIKEANLTASELLGRDREFLKNKGLSTFKTPEDHESFYLHYNTFPPH